MAVEALAAGMVVLLPARPGRPQPERVQLTSPAWGAHSGFRGIGEPRIVVHAYGTVVGASSWQGARHLQWAAGELVEVL